MQRGRWVVVLWGAVVATLVGSGCGQGTPERARAEKPEDVVVLAHRFMHAGDGEGLWALFSSEGQAQMELVLGGIASLPEDELEREFGVRKADIDGLAGEALMTRVMASPVSRVRSKGEAAASVTRVVPAGDDEAIVEYVRGEATCSQHVVRVGGLWKMTDDGGRCSEPARAVVPSGESGRVEAGPAPVVATPVPVVEFPPASAAAPLAAPAAAVAPAAGGAAKPGTVVPIDNPYGP